MKRDRKIVKVAEASDVDMFFMNKLMGHKLLFKDDNLIENFVSALGEFKGSFGPNMTKEALSRVEKIEGWLLHMAYLLDD